MDGFSWMEIYTREDGIKTKCIQYGIINHFYIWGFSCDVWGYREEESLSCYVKW